METNVIVIQGLFGKWKYRVAILSAKIWVYFYHCLLIFSVQYM